MGLSTGSSLKQGFVFFASQNFLLQGQPEVPIKAVVWETSAIVSIFLENLAL